MKEKKKKQTRNSKDETGTEYQILMGYSFFRTHKSNEKTEKLEARSQILYEVPLGDNNFENIFFYIFFFSYFFCIRTDGDYLEYYTLKCKIYFFEGLKSDQQAVEEKSIDVSSSRFFPMWFTHYYGTLRQINLFFVQVISVPQSKEVGILKRNSCF